MKAVPYRELSYAGFFMWGLVLVLFVYWKIIRWSILKKPVKIPAEIGLEKKAEFLAQQRAVWSGARKALKRAGYFTRLGLVFSSCCTLLFACAGLTGSKQFVLSSFTVTALAVPAFFAEFLCLSVTRDFLRRLDENDCILKSTPGEGGQGKLWLVNLLPPLALALFYQARADLLSQLGFGTALAVAVILLSLAFLHRQESVGVGVNFILLGLVFISFLAPRLDFDIFQDSLVLSAAPLLPLLAISCGALFLVRYPLVKRQGVFFSELPKLLPYYSRVPIFLAVLTPIVAAIFQQMQLLPYSLAMVGFQALGWLAVLISLSWAGRRGKVDFAAIRDFIKKDKQYRLPFDRIFLGLVLLGFLSLSAACETYRGHWLFFLGTVIWASFMCLSLWKVWKYAFPANGAGRI
jgi:hypothetical protein